jgi:hypothetical protein
MVSPEDCIIYARPADPGVDPPQPVFRALDKLSAQLIIAFERGSALCGQDSNISYASDAKAEISGEEMLSRST